MMRRTHQTPSPDAGSAVKAPRPLGASGRIVVTILVVAGAVVAASGGIGLLLYVPYAGVAALLVIRRPRNSIGWILMSLSWEFALRLATIDATPEQFADGSVGAPIALFAVAEGAGGGAAFFLLGALAMVFPSGRLPSGRWGLASRAALGGGLLLTVAAVASPVISITLVGYPANVPVPNPAAILPNLQIWTLIDNAFLSIIIVTAAAMISLVVRFRRARGVERQQLLWISASGAFVMLGVGGGFVVASLIPGSGESGLAWIGAIIAFPCVPLAIGIAILRYRLYEIDRIVSRTIAYAVVTGFLVATFAASILLLQGVLAPFTQGQTVAVAASTLAVAALFQPVMRRVRRAVDRRFDRARYDAERTAAAFSERLRDEVDMAVVTSDLVTTTGAALAPASIGIWLRRREAGR